MEVTLADCQLRLVFFQEFFSVGGGAKSIATQISTVMLIFLLFSDQIFFWGAGAAKVSERRKLLQGGASPAPLWMKANPWEGTPPTPSDS